MTRLIVFVVAFLTGYTLRERYKRNQLFSRAKMIVTRKVEYTDLNSGETNVVDEPLDAMWAVFGPQPYEWWWVSKWGSKACGCIVNPFTKRQYLYCEVHGESVSNPNKVTIGSGWLS